MHLIVLELQKTGWSTIDIHKKTKTISLNLTALPLWGRTQEGAPLAEYLPVLNWP